MRTIAIINQKGGCGKTTVSINLAATLASRGQRTLLVDMDPQGHCALGLAVPESRIRRSMGDLLRAGYNGTLSLSEITWQISRQLDLAPSTIHLAGVEQVLSGASDKDRRLTQLLATVQDTYDICVIDCPPSIGLLTFNALRAADEVIIPVETGYFAVHGSIRQEQTVQMLAQRAGHEVRFRVLATMYDVRTKLAREILGELKRHFGQMLLPVMIHFNSKLKEAASFGQPITEYDPGSRGMQDFERLVDWLMSHPPAARRRPSGMDGGGARTRAAELAERARALSRRAAAVEAALGREPAMEAAPQGPERLSGVDASRVGAVYGVRVTAQGLLFVQPGELGHRVQIIGDFNQWDAGATPMRHDEALGVWQVCVPVASGRYRYRLVVDGQARPDPYNDQVESDEHGLLHSVVESREALSSRSAVEPDAQPAR